jgi:hypothetical protein
MGGSNARIADREGQFRRGSLNRQCHQNSQTLKPIGSLVRWNLDQKESLVCCRAFAGPRVMMDDRKRWRGSSRQRQSTVRRHSRPKVVLNAGRPSFCLTHDKFLDHVNSSRLVYKSKSISQCFLQAKSPSLPQSTPPLIQPPNMEHIKRTFVQAKKENRVGPDNAHTTLAVD